MKKVAYFCMEYGIDKDLRLYAGGLGILAGDIMKAACDQELPVVGIGILWRQGYTRQMLGEEGRPYNSYPLNDDIYNHLQDTGVEVKVNIRERDVICRVWKLDREGIVPLYLLDTNLEENGFDSWITGQLYGWFEEERLAQEIVLGIGGVRALEKLDIEVDVYHFNEGHAALAGLELIKKKMNRGLDFEEAWRETRKQIVFTTHTPVKQGNEEHGLEAMRYMGANNRLTLEQMVAIGGAPFNMTVAGLRLSRMANGVAQLHRETALKMWEDVEGRSPIIGITNGVHRGTWVDQRMINAYRQKEGLWETHKKLKQELIDFVENRSGVRLDFDKLIIGFARRMVPYKRSTLIFGDFKKIDKYLEKGEIQLIFSGRSHPLDDEGKKIIADLVQYSKRYPESVVFLEDYNMEIGRYLTRGVDVWLNNPRRPLEASGTSGMKAAMNGVLNLSTLDGWWDEACEHGINGWQFGGGYEGKNQDEKDLEALYQVLFDDVLPLYYKNREKWVEMMYNSIDSTYQRFSAHKMIEEYYNRLYCQQEEKDE